MVKRIDLVKPTRLLKMKKKLVYVTQLMQELYKDVPLESVFLSIEITLNIYNLLINSFVNPKDLHSLHRQIPEVLESIYERALTESQLHKVAQDIRYIHEQRLFTRISAMYVVCYNAWIFFLQAGRK